MDNVSIALHKGEILGITGLLGSGTIELSKIIYGALPKEGGEIYIHGEKKDCPSPRKALDAGIGFVSDDRKQEGLVISGAAGWKAKRRKSAEGSICQGPGSGAGNPDSGRAYPGSGRGC